MRWSTSKLWNPTIQLSQVANPSVGSRSCTTVSVKPPLPVNWLKLLPVPPPVLTCRSCHDASVEESRHVCRLIREYLDLFQHVKSDEFTISFVLCDVTSWVSWTGSILIQPYVQYIQFHVKRMKNQRSPMYICYWMPFEFTSQRPCRAFTVQSNSPLYFPDRLFLFLLSTLLLTAPIVSPCHQTNSLNTTLWFLCSDIRLTGHHQLSVAAHCVSSLRAHCYW